jgi:MFS transporter, DHA1 family, multidrug resistance protein
MMTSLGISRGRLALILGALAMLGPFSIDTIFPAFGRMATDFDVDKLALQQTISTYLLGYASMSLLHGPLSDALGRKPIIIVGLIIFAFACAGAALANSLNELLIYRVIQGMSAGVGLIVGRAIIRDALDGDDAQRLMSMVTMIFGVAPAIAPIIGGWILGFANWHIIFWFLVALTAVIFVAVLWLLPESHPQQNRLELKLSVLAGAYKRILTQPRFIWLALAGALNFGALFLYISSAPALVMDHLRLNEQQFAYFFLPVIGGMVLGSYTSGKTAGQLSTHKLAKIGFTCCTIATLWNIMQNLLSTQPSVLFSIAPIVLLSFGISLVFPVLTLAIIDMFPNERGSASSMQAFIALLSNALIAGFWSPLFSHSTLQLSLAAAGFSALALICWRVAVWIQRRQRSPAF